MRNPCSLVASLALLVGGAGLARAQNLIVNSTFDTNITGVKPFAPVTATFDPGDSNGASNSGSVKLAAGNTSNNGASLCLNVSPSTQYDFGGMILIPSGQTGLGGGGIRFFFWTGANCGGTQSTPSASVNGPGPTGAWTRMASSLTTANDTMSVTFYLQNAASSLPFVLSYDDLFFAPHMNSGAPPVITSGAPPDGFTGTPYNFALTATGDTLVTFFVSAGALPTGLSLTPLGAISGTPSAGGMFSATVTARNGITPDATKVLSFNVEAPDLSSPQDLAAAPPEDLSSPPDTDLAMAPSGGGSSGGCAIGGGAASVALPLLLVLAAMLLLRRRLA